ncbi:MAG: serine/threonine protein kinase [Myxococcaceae bacterium]|nr:serine/threonine protein kinase [Myxococcaceae bacterium]
MTAVAALLLPACGGRAGRPGGAMVDLDTPQWPRIAPLEVRWGDGAWQPVTALLPQPPGRGSATVLEARLTVPQSDCIDPAIWVSACLYLKGATIGSRRVTSTSCFVPVLPAEAGQTAVLHFESTQHMREGEVLAVCQAQQRGYMVSTETSALWLAFALLIAGAFQLLLTLRGGREALTLAALGTFCLGMGVQLLQQTRVHDNLLGLDPPALRAARDVMSFVYPAAFMLLLARILPERRRPLVAFVWAFAAALALALGLQLFGVVSLRAASWGAQALMVAAIIVGFVQLGRSAKKDPAARKLLLGIGIAIALALPDLAWGFGLQLVAQNTAHWGMVVLAATMALVVQDRFRASAAAMEQRLAEIEGLNEELRFQVEARSRELRTALASLPPPTPREARPDDVIGERYRVDALIGRGGMAKVYRVTRLIDGKPFALKLSSGKSSRVDAARFAREAELAARLRHPNLVPVIDVGLVPNGPIYLVMELVDGPSLDAMRDRFGDVAWALRVFADVARGLAAVHAAGVVHRDLKPSNVLLATDAAKLADFGVARPETDAPVEVDTAATAPRAGGKSDHLTHTGAVVGTPRYLAPEVARGEAATRASDVFSLGLLAWELLCAQYPLVEPPYLAALSHRPLERVTPRQPPPVLASLLERMLEPLPEHRPTAAEVAEAVAAVAPARYTEARQ